MEEQMAKKVYSSSFFAGDSALLETTMWSTKKHYMISERSSWSGSTEVLGKAHLFKAFPKRVSISILLHYTWSKMS